MKRRKLAHEPSVDEPERFVGQGIAPNEPSSPHPSDVSQGLGQENMTSPVDAQDSDDSSGGPSEGNSNSVQEVSLEEYYDPLGLTAEQRRELDQGLPKNVKLYVIVKTGANWFDQALRERGAVSYATRSDDFLNVHTDISGASITIQWKGKANMAGAMFACKNFLRRLVDGPVYIDFVEAYDALNVQRGYIKVPYKHPRRESEAESSSNAEADSLPGR